jgi:hypothetical protein
MTGRDGVKVAVLFEQRARTTRSALARSLMGAMAIFHRREVDRLSGGEDRGNLKKISQSIGERGV